MAKSSDKKSFILYHDTSEVFLQLSDEDAGKLIKELVIYSRDITECNPKKPSGLSGLLNVVSTPFKMHIDRDLQSWENKKNANILNGKKGGRPKSKTQTNPKKGVTVTVKDTVKVNVNNETMIKIGSFFKRKPTTKWSEKEVKAYKAIGEISEFDLDIMTKRYNSDDPYLRTSLLTLLNNWNGELDKARNQKNGSSTNQPKEIINYV